MTIGFPRIRILHVRKCVDWAIGRYTSKCVNRRIEYDNYAHSHSYVLHTSCMSCYEGMYSSLCYRRHQRLFGYSLFHVFFPLLPFLSFAFLAFLAAASSAAFLASSLSSSSSRLCSSASAIIPAKDWYNAIVQLILILIMVTCSIDYIHTIQGQVRWKLWHVEFILKWRKGPRVNIIAHWRPDLDGHVTMDSFITTMIVLCCEQWQWYIRKHVQHTCCPFLLRLSAQVGSLISSFL